MTTASPVTVETVDLDATPLRELNQRLHNLGDPAQPAAWRVINPGGRHAIAVGLDTPVEVDIEGHVGYYCAGMNKHATVRVHGNCGVGLAENIMSGSVIVDGNASQSAGATGRGGLVVIHGDASSRCGISMKGTDIAVRGSGSTSPRCWSSWAIAGRTRPASPSTAIPPRPAPRRSRSTRPTRPSTGRRSR